MLVSVTSRTVMKFESERIGSEGTSLPQYWPNFIEVVFGPEKQVFIARTDSLKGIKKNLYKARANVSHTTPPVVYFR